MTDTAHTEIAKRRADILEALADTADPAPVLVAVTKTQPDDAIDAILATGQRVFGENRVQEAQADGQTGAQLFPILSCA